MKENFIAAQKNWLALEFERSIIFKMRSVNSRVKMPYTQQKQKQVQNQYTTIVYW